MPRRRRGSNAGKRKLRSLALLLIVPLLSACLNSKELKRSGQLLWEDPDSALVVLSSIQPDDRCPAGTHARHALLLSMAMQACGEVPPSDSLARLAYDYYWPRGSRSDKMHSANCLAEVEYEYGKLTDAILHYHDALSCAIELGDKRMEGYISQRLGELFALNYDHQEALVYSRRAVDCLNTVGETLSAAYSSVDMARQYLSLDRISRAEALADSLMAFNSFGDPGYNYYLSLLKADICNKNGESADAIRYYRDAEESGYMLPLSSLGQYLVLSSNVVNTENRDSLLNMMKGRVRTGVDSMIFQGVLIESARLQGNYRDAFLSLELLCEIQDRSFTSVISQSATHALNAYFQERLLLEKSKRRVQYLLFALVTLILLVMLSLSLVLLRRRRRQAEAEMSRVEDLARDIQLIRSGKKHSDSIISALVQEKIRSMTQLTEAYFWWTDEAVYQRESKEGRMGKEEIINQFRRELMNLRSDVNFLNAIEENLNQTQNDIMNRVRSDFSGLNRALPKFKEMDFRIILLFFAGFSNKSVSFFMDMSDEAVRSRKKRYKQLFLSLPGGGGEDYLQALTRMPQ